MQAKDFYVLRQPTYPISRLIQFNQQLTRQSLDTLLRQHYADPLAQEAIFAASPALYERFRRWLAGEPLPEEDKLLNTLHKYFIRMCSRPTPYGLFAGCLTGSFGPRSSLEAGTPAQLRTHTRIDMDCLLALRDWIVQQPDLRPCLRLFPNTSIYPVGTALRYVEQQREGDRRHYFISAVEADHFLTQVLQTAQAGATPGALTAGLVALDIGPDEAAAFVEQLIDSQMLVFEIEPTVTGLHYLDQLIHRLSDLPAGADVVAQLEQLRTALRQSDRLVAYADVRRWFLERSIQPPTADVVQVDTFFDVPGLRLSERLVQQLQRDLEKLMVLNQPPAHPDLDAFKRRFYNRYEDEEVPLPLAVDAEFGVGYGSGSTLGVGYAPLIDDLSFTTHAPTQITAWDWWQTFVMDKYAKALRGRQDEITLTDEDLAFIRNKQTQTSALPDHFYMFGTLLARSERDLDDGNYRFNLLTCRGPSAANLLSRFGEGDPALAERIRACTTAEEAHHADVLIAEIVHLPENRVGNILIRPTLHQYEIPYMGQASVPPEFQIPITDLMVSVRNGQVVLRSKRLNRRVIPRLTNAHNFMQGLPIYRFLCDLQAQDAHLQLTWNWSVLRTQAYLPRVRYRNMIISRATWQLTPDELALDNPLRLVAQLTERGIPNQFTLAQGDNELFIAMHVPASLDLLVQELRKAQTRRDRVRLLEFLATPDQCPLHHKREQFTHEVIIPFYNPAARSLPGLCSVPAELPQRKFSLGSEWLYLKVYTGEKTSDALLVQTIYPVVQQLLKTQMISAFFFVRYKDPDPHLRLRFRGNPHLEFYHHVVRAVEKALQVSVESGVVYRIQADTYQRELERYGMEQIDKVEALFHIDSLSTLSFLARSGEVFDENLRFALAVRKIDLLLRGLNFSPEENRLLLGRMKESFFSEFGGDSALRHQLNDKFRTYRPLLVQALSDEFSPAGGADQWPVQQESLLRQLRSALAEPETSYSLTASLIHMVMNRLFPSKQRAYELVVYHCLARHYDSVQARQRVAS